MGAPGLDLPSLQSWLDPVVGGLAGPLEARVLTGGKSNLTYTLSDGVRRWVLRRPPLGPLTPTAHDMAREFRVVAALRETSVPVAKAVALCEDDSVIGVPFAIVGFVEGRTLQSGDDTERLSADAARRISEALVDTLAALHAVPYTEVGLTDFGRPRGYLGRQLKRWRGQWDLVATRRLPAVDRLHGLLAGAVPTPPSSTIVHGDFRLDNVILDPLGDGRILAVVDWEMATLGDPLADLGLLLVYWDPVSEPVLGVRHATTANPGFPSPAELAERYAKACGLPLDHLPFYEALGCFKLAVIAEGIHQRFLAGKTVGDGFATVGDAVPNLLERGLGLL
ncbi:phosphotransferase family protein [Spirillospora sp. CA-108201]